MMKQGTFGEDAEFVPQFDRSLPEAGNAVVHIREVLVRVHLQQDALVTAVSTDAAEVLQRQPREVGTVEPEAQ